MLITRWKSVEPHTQKLREKCAIEVYQIEFNKPNERSRRYIDGKCLGSYSHSRPVLLLNWKQIVAFFIYYSLKYFTTEKKIHGCMMLASTLLRRSRSKSWLVFFVCLIFPSVFFFLTVCRSRHRNLHSSACRSASVCLNKTKFYVCESWMKPRQKNRRKKTATYNWQTNGRENRFKDKTVRYNNKCNKN